MNLLKHLCLPGIFALSSFSAQAQCVTAVSPDSSRIIPNKAITTTAQSGNILYLAGDFSVMGAYTGSCIGVDISTSKPVFHNWPLVRGRVNKMIPDGNGGWYIGGEFQKIGDSLRNHIAHVDANGNVSAWNAGLNAGSNLNDHWVNEMYIHDSILYVGGRFNTFLGDTAANIAAVNINTGQLAVQQWMMDEPVTEITVHNNNIYFGGYFQHVNDSARAKLAAFNLATGQILPWNPDLSYYAYAHVRDIVFVNDRIFIAGEFQVISGVNRRGIAELDPITGYPTNWDPALDARNTHLEWKDGFLYLGANIDTIQGSNYHPVPMLLKIDTSAIPSIDTIIKLDPGAFSNNVSLSDRSFSDFTFYGDTIFLSGDFEKIQGKPRLGVFAWSLSGDSLSSWTCYTGFGTPDHGIFDLLVHNDRLYIGGEFVNIGKFTRGLAAIDMNADTVLNWFPSVGLNSNNFYGGKWVHQLLVDGNRLYLAGVFDSVNSVRRRSIAAIDRITGDLLPWYPELSGTDSSLNCIALSGSSVYLGGRFFAVNNIVRKGLAAVDTITGHITRPWNPHTFAAPQYVYFNSIVAADTSIYVGGTFYDIANVQRKNIVKLGWESGIADPDWHPALEGYNYGQLVSRVNSMDIDGPYLYVAGNFDYVDSQYNRSIAKLRLSDGALMPWQGSQHINTSVGYVSLAGNSLYVGGDSLHVLDKVQGNEHFGTTFMTNNNSRQIRNVNYYNGKLYISGSYTNISQLLSHLTYPFMHHFAWFPIGDVPDISLSGDNPVCENTPVTYTATTQVQNPSYQWQVNDTNVAAITNQFTYTPQNGDRVKCIINDPVLPCFYSSVVAGEMKINVVPSGTVPTATLIGPDTVCDGDYGNYSVNTNVYGGSYQWLVNGTSVGTDSPYYTFAPQDGDSINCTVLTPPLSCYTAATTTSSTISIEVDTAIIPSISITAGDFSTPGTLVWLYANVSNVPNGYTILWLKNGVGYTTTSNGSYTAYTKGSGADTIAAIVFPHDLCFESDTSNAIINYSTGIEETNLTDNIVAYPNPFHSEINIMGLGKNDKIEMYNVVGERQQEWTVNADQPQTRLNIKELPVGLYILRITRVSGEVRKTVPIQKL